MRKRIFGFCIALVIAFTCCMGGMTQVSASGSADNPTASTKAVKKRDSLWNCKKVIKKKIGAFTYHAHPSKKGKEAWIYRIDINMNKNHRKLVIPGKLDNRRVTCLGFDYDPYNSIFGGEIASSHGECVNPEGVAHIKELKMPNSVKVILPEAFAGMGHLKTVTIPKNVTEIGEEAFYSCNRLKKVKLPAALKSLDVQAFLDCPALVDMTLPAKNKTYQIKNKCIIRKKDKALIYTYASEETLNIPEGTKILKTFSFNNCRSQVINIPASVTKIEGGAFHGYGYDETGYGYDGSFKGNDIIRNVNVSEQNPVYAKDGQCIYNKKNNSLSVAVADDNGEIRISEQVSKLTGGYSIVNRDVEENPLTKVVYPKGLKSVTTPGFMLLQSYSPATYFLGENPPVMNITEDYAHTVNVPHGDLYVPKDSLQSYKSWHKKYGDTETFLVRWHTFDPDQEI